MLRKAVRLCFNVLSVIVSHWLSRSRHTLTFEAVSSHLRGALLSLKPCSSTMAKLTSLDLGGLSSDLAHDIGLHDVLTLDIADGNKDLPNTPSKPAGKWSSEGVKSKVKIGGASGGGFIIIGERGESQRKSGEGPRW